MNLIAAIERSVGVRQIRSAELATKPRHLGLPTGAASLRGPLTRPTAWRVTTPMSGPTN